jgi:diguanylate cyclase
MEAQLWAGVVQFAGAQMYSRLIEQARASFCAPSLVVRALVFATIVVGALGGTWLVHATGGAQFATLHVAYLPIILSALVFGGIGGLTAGAICGLLLGPLMPLDVIQGEGQNVGNWLLRTAFFCLVGGIVGVGASTLRRQLNLLDWLTEHDPSTGLLNHAGYVSMQRRAIARARGSEERLVVVAQIKNMLDIQNTFGARFTEELLERVYTRVRAAVPENLQIGLIQRDRLSVSFDAIAETSNLRKDIEARIRLPYEVDDVPVYVDFALGAATFPAHGRTFDEILQKAKIAMHAAATRNLPFVLYETATDATSRENLELLGMISASLANKEFAVWHQAKLHLRTGRIAGTEALLRWRHPQRGFIPPGAFIPQAEKTPLIDDLTNWVIGAALADQAAWRAKGHCLGVAVNVSVHNLHERSLLETLHETVTRYSIDPQTVELEITESAVMDDFDYCTTLMRRLRDVGYRVSIDDFGTGHSSLAYLKKLPVCALKVDQAFIRELARDESDQKIVRTVLELARSLNLESIAEGVEDEEALKLLRDWGCDYAQGYAVHRPAPCADFLAWLDKAPMISAA